MADLPLKTLKLFFKECCSFHISGEAVILLRDVLECVSYRIIKDAVREFDELNKSRIRQGLSPLRRLNSWSVRRASEKVLMGVSNYDMGLQSRGVVGPGGKKMSVDKNVTKSAKGDSNDNGGI